MLKGRSKQGLQSHICCVICDKRFQFFGTKTDAEIKARHSGWSKSNLGWMCNWHRGYGSKDAALEFCRHWEEYGTTPYPKREVSLDGSPEQWRYDFLWELGRGALVVEIDGGIFSQGGHTRGVGFTKDCRKLNYATLQGFRVLRFTTQMLKDDPAGCIEQVLEVLRYR